MLHVQDCLHDRLRRFARSDDLHILLPAGIGDVLWAMTKLHGVIRAREAAGQSVTVWLPEGEQKRAGKYLELIGVACDYLPRLTTRWVWDRNGSPAIPESGWFSAQANRHLESGLRIELWYPELPLEYPVANLNAHLSMTTPHILMFAGSRGYMMGNLKEHEWARIAEHLKQQLSCAIHLIGAANDVEFAQAIMSVARPGTFAAPLFNRPLHEILCLASGLSSIGMVGVASGPLIAATAAGCRTFFAYPRHLFRMPGTWEPPHSWWAWTFVDHLPHDVANGFVSQFLLRAA